MSRCAKFAPRISPEVVDPDVAQVNLREPKCGPVSRGFRFVIDGIYKDGHPLLARAVCIHCPAKICELF